MKKRLFFIIFLLAGISFCSIFLVYHHFFDYDIATILKNPKTYVSNTFFPVNPKLTKIKHVFIIVEENHDWKNIYANPDALYINSLLIQGAYATGYHSVAQEFQPLHPSEPNYIMLEAGQIAFPDHTFTSDNPPSLDNSTNSRNHITSLLEKNGYTWKAYQEDISGNDCPINTTNTYAPKHNPFIFFQDVSGNPPNSVNTYCQKHIRPTSELQQDFATGNIANYTFITPNLLHDMHDGTIAQADTWLSHEVPFILNSPIYKKDGALFITWDEGGDNSEKNAPIGMIVFSQFAKKTYHNALAYSHASYIKTLEEIFGLSPLLGLATDSKTSDLSDLFK